MADSRNRCGDRTCMVHNHIRICGGIFQRISREFPKASTQKRKRISNVESNNPKMNLPEEISKSSPLNMTTVERSHEQLNIDYGLEIEKSAHEWAKRNVMPGFNLPINTKLDNNSHWSIEQKDIESAVHSTYGDYSSGRKPMVGQNSIAISIDSLAKLPVRKLNEVARKIHVKTEGL
eukprot:CAMPEP_0167765694 /NCGR_PEP_ID=MMETSP0110_2-20121227/14859_1 /TAXON_ID=629695 /ORGANISM="Gymnochlora sp., Strain CCMP2014" /LENGTH=176 /DNA_ID=CAMNT_0007653495 /DNA_START=232 /DNA_END=758 /DNA_ORIENTATION=-